MVNSRAFTASCGGIPWSIIFNAVCKVIEIIREPPGEPRTKNTLPSLVTIVGLMDDSGRLPGAMEFLSPCTNPYRFFADFGGEIIHFIIQEEACTRWDNDGAKSTINRVSG